MNAVPDHDDTERRAALLSALTDGELDPGDVQAGCRLWRDDGQARATWHAYHLIGDVLRSEHLGSAPGRDAALLRRVRAQLAQEPAPLAPSPLPAGRSRDPVWQVRRWVAAAGVAGGVAAVVAVMLPTFGLFPAADQGTTIAARHPAAGGVQRVGASPGAGPGQVLVIDGNIIRDARLEAYFEAHRGAVGALPSAVPGGALRSVDMIPPAGR